MLGVLGQNTQEVKSSGTLKHLDHNFAFHLNVLGFPTKTHCLVVTLTMYSTRKNPTAMLSMKPITSTALGAEVTRFQVSLRLTCILSDVSDSGYS